MMVNPDGFIGAVMAVEGIEDATVLMHGPDGCRKNLTSLSNKVYPREGPRIDLGTPYYRGLNRIPCTGIVSTDYIHGAYRKLEDALRFIQTREKGLIVVIPSPGASLIGDDVSKAIRECGLEDRAMVMDSNLISMPINLGMDKALLKIVSTVASDQEKVKNRVNVLGLNILMKDWKAAKEFVNTILALMGLEPGCFLGAGCTLEEIRRSPSAEYNLIIAPEYCTEIAQFYEERFGVKTIDMGYSPVGFTAIREFIDLIAESTGADPGMATDYVRGYEARAYDSMRSCRVDVRGRGFVIDAEPSICYPLVRWMTDYLSMAPLSVRFKGMHNEVAESKAMEYLDSIGLSERMDREWPEYADTVICDGNTAQLCELSKHCRRGVDVGFPSITNTDFRRSPVIGCEGALYLLDRLMNSLGN